MRALLRLLLVLLALGGALYGALHWRHQAFERDWAEERGRRLGHSSPPPPTWDEVLNQLDHPDAEVREDAMVCVVRYARGTRWDPFAERVVPTLVEFLFAAEVHRPAAAAELLRRLRAHEAADELARLLEQSRFGTGADPERLELRTIESPTPLHVGEEFEGLVLHRLLSSVQHLVNGVGVCRYRALAGPRDPDIRPHALREAAALALGALDDVRAIEPLSALLDHPQTQDKAFAQSLLVDGFGAGAPLPILLDAYENRVRNGSSLLPRSADDHAPYRLLDHHAELRAAVRAAGATQAQLDAIHLRLLEERGGVSSLFALQQLAHAGATSAVDLILREELLEQFGRFQFQPSGADAGPLLHSFAAYALGELGDPRALPALESLLDPAHPRAQLIDREAVRLALAKLRGSDR